MKQFNLTITQNGKTLYDGDLQAASLNQEISLGTLETGKNSRVQFTLQLPAELKNAYAKRESMVNWIFRVQGAEEPGKNEMCIRDRCMHGTVRTGRCRKTRKTGRLYRGTSGRNSGIKSEITKQGIPCQTLTRNSNRKIGVNV